MLTRETTCTDSKRGDNGIIPIVVSMTAVLMLGCPEDKTDTKADETSTDTKRKEEKESETKPEGSQGCRKGETSPETGELTLTLEGEEAPYLVTLPDEYDGATPMPMVFTFHGANRTHKEMYNVDAAKIKSTLGKENIMVYPKSQGGSAWTGGSQLDINTQFFEKLYDRMREDYCVDDAKVFAVGLSSGGGFTNVLACRYGDILRAVGPVSSFMMETECKGEVAAMVIHGERDSVVAPENGEETRDFYLSRSGCGDKTVDFDIEPCVIYEGCADETPVGWCQHGEPTYEDTNHGWPSFASEALAEFFKAL